MGYTEILSIVDFSEVRKSIVYACKNNVDVKRHIIQNGLHSVSGDDGSWDISVGRATLGLTDILVYLGNHFNGKLRIVHIAPEILLPADFVYTCCDCFVEYNLNGTMGLSILWKYKNSGAIDVNMLKFMLSSKGEKLPLGRVLDCLGPIQGYACYLYNDGYNNILKAGSAFWENNAVDRVCALLINKFGAVEEAYLFLAQEDDIGSLGEYLTRKYTDKNGAVTIVVYPNNTLKEC